MVPPLPKEKVFPNPHRAGVLLLSYFLTEDSLGGLLLNMLPTLPRSYFPPHSSATPLLSTRWPVTISDVQFRNILLHLPCCGLTRGLTG